MAKNKQVPPDDPTGAHAAYIAAVAPEAVEIDDDRLRFPGAVLLPLTVRAGGAPGMPHRPWARLRAVDFLTGVPTMYSVALRREAPDALRSSLRVRRTVMEGVLLALSEKTGRRPSRAEQTADAALDDAESRLAMGEPAFRAALLAGMYAVRGRETDADLARRSLESRLRAKGFISQRLAFVAERSILHLQPGGELFPGIFEPTLMPEEAVRLVPMPERDLHPPPHAAYLGNALRDGRDIYFSPEYGFDPAAVRPPHATTLVLGEMGSGKTSLLRSILFQRLLQGRRVFSLDPEGENNALCRALGGRVVPAGQPLDPETCLLHPLEAGSAGELLFAVRFLLSALNGGAPVPPVTQAVLHDIVQDYWRAHPGEVLPLASLSEALAAKPDGAGEASALLRPFCRGGLWDGFFDRGQALLDRSLFEAEEDPDACLWWNFDLSALREENRSIVHALLTWFLYRVISVVSAPVDIYLDEGWRLMRSPVFSTLLDELGRRARKRGIGIFLATHLPGDINENSSSLGLASSAFAGRLPPRQAEDFLVHFGVPADAAGRHAERIARLPPHNFYAIPAAGRGSLFGFQARIPPEWLAFWARSGAAR